MIFDQNRCDWVMRQIFDENGLFLAQSVLELLNPDRLRQKTGKTKKAYSKTVVLVVPS